MTIVEVAVFSQPPAEVADLAVTVNSYVPGAKLAVFTGILPPLNVPEPVPGLSEGIPVPVITYV